MHYCAHFIGRVGKVKKFHFDQNLSVIYKPTHLRGGKKYGHFLCSFFEHVLYLVSYFLHWIHFFLQSAFNEKTIDTAPLLQTGSPGRFDLLEDSTLFAFYTFSYVFSLASLGITVSSTSPKNIFNIDHKYSPCCQYV